MDGSSGDARITFPGSKAETYCRSRGWGADTCRKFELGYLPPASGSRESFADREAVEELGLNLVRSSGTWLSDRMIIPIFSRKQRAVAVATRTLPPDDHGTRYVNSRRSPIFHRDETLYGEDRLAWYGGRFPGNALFVVEGYADVWALHERGVAAVAIMGDRMTRWQAEALAMRRLNTDCRLVLAFDGDDEGEKGEEQAMVKLIEMGCPSFRLKLPSGDVADAASGADPAGAAQLQTMADELKRWQEQ